jgi:hypothetical protein
VIEFLWCATELVQHATKHVHVVKYSTISTKIVSTLDKVFSSMTKDIVHIFCPHHQKFLKKISSCSPTHMLTNSSSHSQAHNIVSLCKMDKDINVHSVGATFKVAIENLITSWTKAPMVCDLFSFWQNFMHGLDTSIKSLTSPTCDYNLVTSYIGHNLVTKLVWFMIEPIHFWS